MEWTHGLLLYSVIVVNYIDTNMKKYETILAFLRLTLHGQNVLLY